jgi:hypothetical protein
MIAAQPGWPELMQVGAPRELWRLLTPDLIELHPDLEDSVEIIGDECGMDKCDFDADWQSVYNLIAFLGEAATDEEAAEIVAAWKRQPDQHRKKSWLQNGGHPWAGVAQLLGSTGPQAIPFRKTVNPWLHKLVAVASISNARLQCPPATIIWIAAETPLGTTRVPHVEIDGKVFVTDPVFSTCPVWLGDHHRRDAEFT